MTHNCDWQKTQSRRYHLGKKCSTTSPEDGKESATDANTEPLDDAIDTEKGDEAITYDTDASDE